jgi:hypothetical protein
MVENPSANELRPDDGYGVPSAPGLKPPEPELSDRFEPSLKGKSGPLPEVPQRETVSGGSPPSQGSQAMDEGIGLRREDDTVVFEFADDKPEPGTPDPDQETGPPRPDQGIGAPRPDQESGGYDRMVAAQDDLRVLVSALDEVAQQLVVLSYTLQEQLDGGRDRLDSGEKAALEEQVDLAVQIAPEVHQLKDTANELVARGPDQAPDLAFSATAQMSALRSDVRRARKRFSANRVWKSVWDMLKELPQRLLSLISHLVKVKEWSVTGQVGTGMLGLAQASISVTFG